MTDITLPLTDTDEVLLVRYLNLAIREAEKMLDLIDNDIEFYSKHHPVIISNAKFDLAEPKRLKAIIEDTRAERKEADRIKYGF